MIDLDNFKVINNFGQVKIVAPNKDDTNNSYLVLNSKYAIRLIYIDHLCASITQVLWNDMYQQYLDERNALVNKLKDSSNKIADKLKISIKYGLKNIGEKLPAGTPFVFNIIAKNWIDLKSGKQGVSISTVKSISKDLLKLVSNNSQLWNTLFVKYAKLHGDFTWESTFEQRVEANKDRLREIFSIDDLEKEINKLRN